MSTSDRMLLLAGLLAIALMLWVVYLAGTLS